MGNKHAKDMARKLMKARRAISPVISALLLIAITVAAGLIAYGYVTGWLGSATKSAGAEYGKLQFDSLYATSGTPGTIKMYVRNVGGKDLTLNKIYVDGVEKANATIITSTSGVITVQAVKYLEVSMNMNEGYFYEVTVACTDGTTVAQSVEAE